MRIGNPSNNEFILELNKINEEIQVEYLKKIIHVTRNVNCDVMLGDSSTKKVETFDIKNVETFFGRFESIFTCNWTRMDLAKKARFILDEKGIRTI